MKVAFLLMFLMAGCMYLSSWAETTPNSSVDDAETPPEGQDTAGDPVGVIDGNVLDAAVDVRVECPRIDLVFKRAYGSWFTREGDLGYGWSHSFEWRLEADGEDGFSLYAEADPSTAGCGAVHRFPAPGDDGESVSSTGTMRLRENDGGATSSMVTQVLDDSECLSWGKVGNDALWGGIGGGALGMVGQGLKGPLGLAVSADVSIWSGVISSETR